MFNSFYLNQQFKYNKHNKDKTMFAIALGMSKLETITVAISSFIFIGAFTWVSIKGDLRKLAAELIEENDKRDN